MRLAVLSIRCLEDLLCVGKDLSAYEGLPRRVTFFSVVVEHVTGEGGDGDGNGCTSNCVLTKSSAGGENEVKSFSEPRTSSMTVTGSEGAMSWSLVASVMVEEVEEQVS